MVDKLFGQKVGMTRHFVEEGKSVPVTVLKVGPCVVIQKKTLENEGYNAIQVGYGGLWHVDRFPVVNDSESLERIIGR